MITDEIWAYIAEQDKPLEAEAQKHIEAMRLATESGDSDAFDVALRAFEDVRVERNRFFHARCVLLSFEQSREQSRA